MLDTAAECGKTPIGKRLGSGSRWPAAALALLPPRWRAVACLPRCRYLPCCRKSAAPAGVLDQVAQFPQKLQLASPLRLAGLPGISCRACVFRAGWLPHLRMKCDLSLAEMSHAKASQEGQKAKFIDTTFHVAAEDDGKSDSATMEVVVGDLLDQRTSDHDVARGVKTCVESRQHFAEPAPCRPLGTVCISARRCLNQSGEPSGA